MNVREHALAPDDRRIDSHGLRAFVADVLRSFGMRSDDAAIGADILVESDLRGIRSLDSSDLSIAAAIACLP